MDVRAGVDSAALIRCRPTAAFEGTQHRKAYRGCGCLLHAVPYNAAALRHHMIRAEMTAPISTVLDSGFEGRGDGAALDMRQIILALVVTAVIVGGGILAGVSQYASSRHVLIHDAETRASRFDTVYREASEARLQS